MRGPVRLPCLSACLFIPVSFIDVAMLPVVIAILHLTAPMDFWRNTAPFFMAAPCRQDLGILEDDIKNEKNTPQMKMTSKVKLR